MKFMVFLNGKEYFTEPLDEGVSPDAIWERHPDCMFLDFASSSEDTKFKIERDRGRHGLAWE
jgi:hypothetical protein